MQRLTGHLGGVPACWEPEKKQENGSRLTSRHCAGQGVLKTVRESQLAKERETAQQTQ